MGFVAKAKIRKGMEGGSAFHKKGVFGQKKNSGSLEELRKSETFYALKSIQIDRVSPMFLKELENEIDVLRTLVRPIGVIIRLVAQTFSPFCLEKWTLGPPEHC